MIDYGYGGSTPGAPGNLGGVAPNNPSFGAYQSPLGGRMSIMGQSNAVPQANVSLTMGQVPLQEQTLRERAGAQVQALRSKIDAQGQRFFGNQQRRNLLFNRGAMLGGATVLATGAIPGALEAVQEGNALGGGANLLATGGGLAASAGASRLVKNPLMKAGVMAIGGVLSGIAGQAAEEGVGKITGKGSSQGAQNTKLRKDAEAQAERMKILGGAAMQPYVQANIDLGNAAMEQRLTELQRSLPMYNQMKNADLVRQQALNASNAQNYMAMGTVATAGKLALGAQAEAGANLRTAMTANPYANSTLQAPNISFG